MKIKQGRIKNFRSFGDEEQMINFDSNGIKLIIGNNKMTGDSNGAGKSSLFKALFEYCIYGTYDSKIDNAINNQIEKNLKTELTFFIKENKYCITRYRKHDKHKNNLYLFKNDKDISFKNNKETQELINNIIKINKNSFLNSIFINFNNSFFKKSNIERIEIFENLLQFNMITKYYKKTDNIIKTLTQNYETNEKVLIEKNESIKTLKSFINTYKENIEKKEQEINNNISLLENKLKELNKIDFDLIQKQNEQNLKLLKEIDILNNRKQIISNNIKEINNEMKISNLLSKMKKNSDEIESINENNDLCPLCGNKIKKDDLQKYINKNKNELKEIREEIKKLENEEKKQNEENEKYIKEIKEIDETIENMKNDLIDLDIDYYEKEKNKKGKIIDKIESLKDNIKNLDTVDLNEQKEKLNEIIKYKDDLKKQLEKIENKLKEFRFIKTCFSNRNGGLKKHLINKYLPIFNNKLNNYLFNFFDNIIVQFDENLQCSIIHDKKEKEFIDFSDGEKMRLELASVFSLFEMVRLVLNNEINIIVLDEILDMNLDTIGTHGAINIIESLAEENQVFIISHSDKYNDYFNDKLIIEKNENGFTKILQ